MLWHPPDTVDRIILKGLGNGLVQHSARSYFWDISGSCTDSVPRFFWSRDYIDKPKGRKPVNLELHVPCRRCDACRKKRKHFWAKRALTELAWSNRTWFGTLSFYPSVSYKRECEARLRLARSGTDFDRLPAVEKFVERTKEHGKDLTLYLKRLRKRLGPGRPFKYLAVAEPHKSGYLHFHCLVHERGGNITEKELRDPWKRNGSITEFKLCESPDMVYYVAKYLHKYKVARVRASLLYGLAVPTVELAQSTPLGTVAAPAIRETQPLQSGDTKGNLW